MHKCFLSSSTSINIYTKTLLVLNTMLNEINVSRGIFACFACLNNIPMK